MEDRAWHYLKANETTRVPRSVIVVDTEARRARRRWGHEQSWRCGVAWFHRARKGRAAIESTREYLDPRTLWTDVSDHCRRRGRTILYMHNVGYDVRVADAFTILPEQGWKLVAQNMAPRGTWLIWRRGEATLSMVDSGSIWPTDLVTIGKWFGMGKLRLPDEDDSDAAWLARCRRDVDILRTAVAAYLQWIETADLGNWQVTGAGQGFTVFRHRHLTHRMLIHDDRDALAAERRAMWTGRCEAYWHGQIGYQEVDEWDLSNAYARQARDDVVPVRLVGPIGSDAGLVTALRDPGLAVLAEIEIETDVPIVPCHHDGRILWPVGRFTTTLWGPELRLVRDAPAKLRLVRGWIYRAAPALRSWATWVIESLDATDQAVPAWQKAIIKAWARSVIGRFAMQHSTWEQLADLAEPGIDRRTCLDIDTGEQFDLMQVGRALWQETGTVDWNQSMPMVTGYITSAVRARMWRIIQALPKEAVLYCDTDSILATDRWRSTIGTVAAAEVGAGLRLKRTWHGIHIMGPRQVVTGPQVRIAGIPRGAHRLGRNEFAGEVWESLARGLATGHPATVRTMDRIWRPQGTDRRRQTVGVGWTLPIRIEEVAS
jgi:hypothetical protein